MSSALIARRVRSGLKNGWNFSHILGGSVSSVSRPQIARVGAIVSIFRDLQDWHSFAPLQSQNFSEKSSSFFVRMNKIFNSFIQFCDFSVKIVIFRWNFDEILPGFRDMLQILAKIADILLKSADFFRKFREFFDISEVVHSVRMKNSIQSLVNRED